MYQFILIVHILAALAIVGLVLLQQGRGADAGAGISGGGSNSVFGARGAASFLSRTTAVLATVFFGTSLTLAYLATSKDNTAQDIMDVPSQVAPVKQDLPPVSVEPSAPVKSDVPVPVAPSQNVK